MKVNFWYLFWGHAIFWIAIAAYSLMLHLKGASLKRQLEELGGASGDDVIGGEGR